jgi:hypothetical protein
MLIDGDCCIENGQCASNADSKMQYAFYTFLRRDSKNASSRETTSFFSQHTFSQAQRVKHHHHHHHHGVASFWFYEYYPCSSASCALLFAQNEHSHVGFDCFVSKERCDLSWCRDDDGDE